MTFVFAATVSTTAPSRAEIEPAVNGEAVDYYYDSTCNTLLSHIVCVAEMDNFITGMTGANSIYTLGLKFTDVGVFDTDFTDPDFTQGTLDDDTSNFDREGSSIGYVSLHGSAIDMTEQTCLHTSQCTNPPAGMTNPGVCVGPGPNNGTYGWCSYLVDKTLITSQCGLDGRKYNGTVDYTSGIVKLGETPFASWAGAGTNGGLQFAAVVNSLGVRFGLVGQEVLPMFAGATDIGLVMPITPGHLNGQFADDVDAPARGTAFANGYVMGGQSSSIGMAWVDSIVGIPYNDGAACGGSYSAYGGGEGINYCGAQIVVAMDANESSAVFDRDTKDWVETQDTARGAAAFGWWTYRWLCNYDCNKYPINLN